MNIFDRRSCLRRLEKDITKYAKSITRGYSNSSLEFTIILNIDPEILKDLNYWTIPVEYILEYVDADRLQCDEVELTCLRIDKINYNGTEVKSARLTYTGRYGADLSMFTGDYIDATNRFREQHQPISYYTDDVLLSSRDSSSGESLYVTSNNQIITNLHLAEVDVNKLN